MFPGGCLVLHPFFPLCSRCGLLEFLSGVRGEPTQNYPKNEFQRRLLKAKLPCPVIWPVHPTPAPSVLLPGTGATSPRFPF